MTDEKRLSDLEKAYAAGRRSDPLFGRVERNFQPDIRDLYQLIGIEQIPYQPPFGKDGTQRVNFSLRPELLQEVQFMAGQYDMSTSAMVDALLRVALGDWDEYCFFSEEAKSKTNQEAE